MVVFSQAAVASSVGSVQHLFAGEHHHMMLSDITVDYAHHDGDHHNQDRHHDHLPDGNPSDGHATGHHHHHGDVGSSVIVLGGSLFGLLRAWDNKGRPVSDRLTVNVRQFLPERPPKNGLSRA